MMRLMQLHSHWSPEEAYSILMLLDELRDSIWQNYRDEIIEYCHQQHVESKAPTLEESLDIADDIIPF